MQSWDSLLAERVLPVVVLEDRAEVAVLAEAAIAVGHRTIEVTLRSPLALSAIQTLSQDHGLVVGAGTVITRQQVDSAATAGARFVVSPGLDPELVEYCQTVGMPVLPGIATATEVQRAIRFGLDTVKFFPASAAGGVAMIEALAGPFPDIRFVPTGGLTAENAPDYLASPSVAAVGGNWMAPRHLLAGQHVSRVAGLLAAARSLAGVGVER